MPVFFFVLFLGLGFGAQASAATYYIDATRGNDDNAGTSMALAWQNVTKIRTIRASIVAGDTILLACDSKWDTNKDALFVDAGFVGTSESRITITSYAPSGVTCGSNKPWITGYNNTVSGDWTWDTARSSWYMPVGGSGTWGGSVLLFGAGLMPGVAVQQTNPSSPPAKDYELAWYSSPSDRIYVYAPSAQDPVTYYGGVRLLVKSIFNFYGSSGSYVTVEGLKITDCGAAFNGYASTGLPMRGVIFRNNEVARCANGTVLDATGVNQIMDFEVSGNTFTDIYSRGVKIGPHAGPNGVIQNNVFNRIGQINQGAGIYVQGNNSLPNQNVLVRGNHVSYAYFGVNNVPDGAALYADLYGSGVTFVSNYVDHSRVCFIDDSGKSTNVFKNNVCDTDIGFQSFDVANAGILSSTIINNTFLCSANRYVENGNTSWQGECGVVAPFFASGTTTPTVKNNLFWRVPDSVTASNSILNIDSARSYLTNTRSNLFGPSANVFADNWSYVTQVSDVSNRGVTTLGLNATATAIASDASLTYLSPAIDAGIDTGITADYASNPIYGTPDIGAYEYQPPHTMSTDEIDIAAGARVYGNGKFRDVTTTGGTTADLAITPQSGSFPTYNATDARPLWLDISSITWSNTGNHHKQWTESSTTIGSTSTLHTIGDLEASKYYTVVVDSVTGANIVGANGTTCTSGVCRSNMQGKISFMYSGGYSTHTFDVTEGDNVAPILNATAPATSLSSGTTQAAVVLATDEDASCKYTTITGVAYASMTDTFATTDNRTHTFTAIGLADGASYTYYARCVDTTGNVSDEYEISFSVASPDSDNHKKKDKPAPARKVSTSKQSVTSGSIVTERGKNFSKKTIVSVYFSKSDGTYAAPVRVMTNKSGDFTLKHRIIRSKGTYKWYALDTKTGKKSKVVTYKVR